MGSDPTDPKNSKNDVKAPHGGIQGVADMLNYMDKETREKVLANVAARDRSVAEKIQDKMFVFESIVELESRDIQVLLREVPTRKLAIALRNASDELKAHLFKNLSARATQTLQDEVTLIGPQRLSDVTAAQVQIVSLAKKLRGIK